MFKKLFTLILAFTQLITGSCIGFTVSTENFNKLKTHLSVCEGYPGNISDVDCATRASILDMKDMGLSQKSLFKVGPKNEFDIHLLNYNNIEDFAKLMERLLKNSAQKIYVNKVLSTAFKEPKVLADFFHLSEKDAALVLGRWLAKAKYANFLSPEAMESLTNKIAKTALHVPKGKKLEQKALKCLEKIKKNTVKMEVYEDAIEQVFDKIQKNAWVGNDALLVKLNYDPTYYNAFTEFRKEGFEYNNKTIANKFKDTLEDLSKIIKNLDNHHEEL